MSKKSFKALVVLASLILLVTGIIMPVNAQLEGFGPVDNFRVWNLDEYETMSGGTIAEFNEAPMLAEKVAAGELPPLEERLPVREDILVVQPREAIGTYGGEIRFNATNPNSFGNTGFSAWDQTLAGFSTNWEVTFPQVARSIEMSEDQTSVTITFRRGMKWSDGTPFTTDDVMFWYEAIMMREELPKMPTSQRPGGKEVVIEKVDDVTVRFTYAVPYPAAIATFTSLAPFAPRHYLEQWHIDYNPEAGTLAASEGYATWAEAFVYHYEGQTGNLDFDPNLPVLKPWRLESTDEFGNRFYVRNPYYWKVDTEGNQLPYIDRQVRALLAEPDVVLLNVQAGDLDYAYFNLGIGALPSLRASETAGDYTTILWPASQGAMSKYQFNLTVGDPVLREIFNDVRFRQAMSLAVNRDEINTVLFFDLAVPRQWGVPSASPFYEDWMGSYFASYDVDQANALLDEMGLQRGADGMRMRPDGEPLRVVLWDAINRTALTELMAEYWEAVGVDIEINPTTREAFQQALIANEVQASVWFADLVAEVDMYLNPIWFRPPYGIDATPVGGGLAWRMWWLSDGTDGEEPSDPYYTEQMELVDAFQLTARGSDEYYELGRQIVTRTVEQMLHIGTVGEAPEVFVRANRLQNFPPVEGTVYIRHLQSGHSDQWYVTGE